MGREQRLRPVAAWRNVGLEDIRDHGLYVVLAARGAAHHWSAGASPWKSFSPLPGDPVFDGFLAFHGEGVFAVLYAVPDRQQVELETTRLRGLGVRVLHTFDAAGGRYTFFEHRTVRQVCPGAGHASAGRGRRGCWKVTHLGLVIRISCARFGILA